MRELEDGSIGSGPIEIRLDELKKMRLDLIVRGMQMGLAEIGMRVGVSMPKVVNGKYTFEVSRPGARPALPAIDEEPDR